MAVVEFIDDRFFNWSIKMLKYIVNGENAGKVLKWEIMIASGSNVITMSALAKSMKEPITKDIDTFSSKRQRIPGVDRFDDEYRGCDISRIVAKSSGDYISISYSICINRISSKDIENLKEMGFIEIMS